MRIILDGIIFSLQGAGGISVGFSELLKRSLSEGDMEVRLLEYRNENIFRKQIRVPQKCLINNNRPWMPLLFERYLNPRLTEEGSGGIFHSSYYRISRNRHVANVTTVHDFTYEYFRSRIPRFVHHTQKTMAIKNADKVICVSQSTKLDLLRFFPGINEQKLAVIYNGVDAAYRPLPVASARELKKIISYDAGEYILYVGDRAMSYKNFRLAAAAARIIAAPLVIAGGGALTKGERLMLDALLGHGNYQQPGKPDNYDLNLLYNHALCLVYPSLYEGFGIPVVEAQRAGCPVIASASSAIPEIAGKGALLLENITEQSLADAIRQIKTSAGISADLKKEGFLNASRFSWETNFKEIKSLYATIS